MTIKKNWLALNGSVLGAEFESQEQADAYLPDAGAVEIPVRPSPSHIWQNGAWVDVPPKTIDEIDLDTLNVALAKEGSVVRALALVLLQEINTLRGKVSLAPYTPAQLVVALKAKMR